MSEPELPVEQCVCSQNAPVEQCACSQNADIVRKTITVNCDVATAFRIWTEQIHLWWPQSHLRSGDAAAKIILEGRSGGRLFERTPGGLEYEWGEVTIWEPPRHLALDWYLGSGPDEPTRVDVHFVAQADGVTRIDVAHRGPELIGALWTRNQTLYAGGWAVALAAYQNFQKETT